MSESEQVYLDGALRRANIGLYEAYKKWSGEAVARERMRKKGISVDRLLEAEANSDPTTEPNSFDEIAFLLSGGEQELRASEDWSTKVRELISDPQKVDDLTETELDYYLSNAEIQLKAIKDDLNKNQNSFLGNNNPFLDLVGRGIKKVSDDSLKREKIAHEKLIALIEKKQKRLTSPTGNAAKDKIKAQITDIQNEIDRLNGERVRKLKNVEDEDDQLRIHNRYDNLIYQLEEELLELSESIKSV